MLSEALCQETQVRGFFIPQRTTSACLRMRSSRCFSRHKASWAAFGPSSGSTAYFTLPSNSPMIRSAPMRHPKSANPNAPSASSKGYCRMGLGTFNRNIPNRLRLSPAV